MKHMQVETSIETSIEYVHARKIYDLEKIIEWHNPNESYEST